MASNVEAAKEAYAQFGQGDLAALKEGFAEDAEWVTSDELPLGGVTSGRDQIIQNFGQIPQYWSEFSVEPDRFLDAGDAVVVTGVQRATGKGGNFESRFIHILEFRDGKTIRGEFHSDTAKALRALGD